MGRVGCGGAISGKFFDRGIKWALGSSESSEKDQRATFPDLNYLYIVINNFVKNLISNWMEYFV